MAEVQAENRQSLESAVVRGNLASQARGQIFGFIIGLAAIGGGVYLIAIGKNIEGLVSVITALAALTGIFGNSSGGLSWA